MIAAVSLNYDPAVSAVAQRLIAGKVITKEEAQYANPIFFKCFVCFDKHRQSKQKIIPNLNQGQTYIKWISSPATSIVF